MQRVGGTASGADSTASHDQAQETLKLPNWVLGASQSNMPERDLTGSSVKAFASEVRHPFTPFPVFVLESARSRSKPAAIIVLPPGTSTVFGSKWFGKEKHPEEHLTLAGLFLSTFDMNHEMVPNFKPNLPTFSSWIWNHCQTASPSQPTTLHLGEVRDAPCLYSETSLSFCKV